MFQNVIRYTRRCISSHSRSGILRIHGPDQKGIVAASSQLLDHHGFSIVQSEQLTDGNDFYQRTVFHSQVMHNQDEEYAFNISNNNNDHNDSSSSSRSEMETQLLDLKQRFNLTFVDLDWRSRMMKKKRMAIFVSKYDHCLWEIFLRHKAKELINCEIVAVFSNHSDLQQLVETFHVPFEVFPITKENKAEQEKIQIDLLKNKYQVDVIVLARYMQVLSHVFLNAFSNGGRNDMIINIHHSFLPAFMGERPYHKAHERGVKLIGATAHYVTEKLDEGPIIDQDVIRVSHRDSVKDLVRKGRIIERNVLWNALEAHLDNRVISHGNKCVVFSE